MEITLFVIVIIVLAVVLKRRIDGVYIKLDELQREVRKLSNLSIPTVEKEKEVIEASRKEPEVVIVEEEIAPQTEPEIIPQAEPEVFDPPVEEETAEQEEWKLQPEEEVVVMPPLASAKPVYQPLATPKKPRKVNYEKYIGENLFGKIGILILVAGVGFFVKYAIDQDWINEVMRTVLGFVVGVCLLLIAERLKKKYRPFSSLLAGGAFAVFYVTVAVAYHYYHIFSQPVAFAILIVITIMMSVLAVLYDHRELAVIALIGGFIAPFLVSSGEGNYKVLYTYILILNLGMFGLSFVKKWAELPVISFVFTTAIMALNVFIYYDNVPFVVMSPTGYPLHMLIFSTLFYFIFILPVLSILKSDMRRVNGILLLIVAINNFVYLAFGLYFIRKMGLPFKIDGALPLLIAVVNTLLLLWFRKEKKDYQLLINTMLGMILVFVTIAVPIQLNGQMITLLWASEMIVLIWLYIKTRIRLYECFAFILIIITVFSFLTNIFGFMTFNLSKTNYLVTHLYTGISFLAVALLMQKYKDAFEKSSLLSYRPWNAMLISLSAIIIYYVFAREIALRVDPWDILLKAQILFTVGYFGILAFCLQKRFPIQNNSGFYYLTLMVSTLLFAADSYLVTLEPESGRWNVLLSWGIVLAVVINFIEVARQSYKAYKRTTADKGFMIYFTILATVCWVCLENTLLNQFGITDDKSAGLSIALSLAGFIQMALGMRLHIKVLRKLSLFTLGIVLVKLVLTDLWALPTVGKIIVFIFLGVTLLVLSFLYQKLKNVIFKEDEEEEE